MLSQGIRERESKDRTIVSLQALLPPGGERYGRKERSFVNEIKAGGGRPCHPVHQKVRVYVIAVLQADALPCY
jgi:hypothetical protein